MAINYVSHAYDGKIENLERAKKITHDLQVNDLENSYICPLYAHYAREGAKAPPQ